MKVVGIGGGHGLAETLRAALLYADEVAAVVAVADDGGSSGRIVRELGVPPPGDVRNCLVALAGDRRAAELYQHRFRHGELTGHTVGNLIIAALTELYGDFDLAAEATGEMLGARGRVFPATTQLVTLGARVAGGTLSGQVAVGGSTAPIEAVYLEPPDPVASHGAVEAIAAADQVVLGPGSLFTSLIATVIVPGITDALRATRARRIFVCNTRTQPGETGGLDAAAHVAALVRHVGGPCLDTALVQAPILGNDGVAYERDLWPWPEIELLEADVVAPEGSHSPQRLAHELSGLGPRPSAGLG